MAHIVLADDGIVFDGNSLREGPLGGVESAVTYLTETLARRGHRVQVRNKCRQAAEINGVDYAPLSDGLPETADLYIANRSDKLIAGIRRARRTAFWLHNPATYLLKWRYIWKLALYRPMIVFIGDHHSTTCPAWVPSGGRSVITYAVDDVFRDHPPPVDVPRPRAIFTSNPMRSLDWLLDLWESTVHPAVPQAEFHVFSGPATYRGALDKRAELIGNILDRARSLEGAGVVLRDPLPKSELMGELATARVMPYRGDVGETYCLAVAEAQALGIPAVVQNIGNLAERVVDGETGYVENDDTVFAERVISLLSDDALWRRQSAAAIAQQRSWSWDDTAAAFEALIPS